MSGLLSHGHARPHPYPERGGGAPLGPRDLEDIERVDERQQLAALRIAIGPPKIEAPPRDFDARTANSLEPSRIDVRDEIAEVIDRHDRAVDAAIGRVEFGLIRPSRCRNQILHAHAEGCGRAAACRHLGRDWGEYIASVKGRADPIDAEPGESRRREPHDLGARMARAAQREQSVVRCEERVTACREAHDLAIGSDSRIDDGDMHRAGGEKPEAPRQPESGHSGLLWGNLMREVDDRRGREAGKDGALHDAYEGIREPVIGRERDDARRLEGGHGGHYGAGTIMAAMAVPSTLEEFQRQLPEHHLAPLWEVLRTLTPREPPTVAVPAIWRAAELREQILAAGRLITAEQAERRVLVLENPALHGQSRITTSLYAGIQLILPGETARSHRHTAAALRLVLEGEGAYTLVNGERIPMHRGDLVITPSWSFHEHGNTGSEPVLWLDGLDVPIVNALNAAFAEEDVQRSRAPSRPEGDALARFGSGMAPLAYRHEGRSTPLCSYPYERTREALEVLRRTGPWDEHCGLRLAFTDPTTGASPIVTMGTYVQLVPARFSGRRYRSTDGAVFTVLSGRGRVELPAPGPVLGPGRVLGPGAVLGPEPGPGPSHAWTLEPNDIFVVPGWTWYSLSAEQDLVLFSFSDRPLQQHLGLWREQRD